MDSACPRCGGAFHCGANDAAPCACSTLKLDAAVLLALRKQYETCLCLACLRTLASAPSAADMKKAGPV
jgi:Cysteine-rich CWC